MLSIFDGIMKNFQKRQIRPNFEKKDWPNVCRQKSQKVKIAEKNDERMYVVNFNKTMKFFITKVFFLLLRYVINLSKKNEIFLI